MRATVAEILTEQFYAWERRGRGWQVWDERVALEPPFAPFQFHFLPPQRPPMDDGRRPTLLSRLTDRLLGEHTNGTRESALALDEAPDPEPTLDRGSEVFAELRVSLPAESEIMPEVMEQCLLTLPGFGSPVAFEVVGSEDLVVVQLACAASACPVLRQQLKAYFPEATVSASDEYLAGTWAREPAGSSVVVDFGLAEEFMLPLKVIRRLSVDPLTATCAALADLEPGETGVLQILLEPVRHPWAASIMRAVLDDDGSPFFLDAPELTALAREKVSRQLFACVIRVAARSPSAERAMLIARSIGWSLNALANPPANRLIPLHNERYPNDAHERDLLERRTRRSGMILSSAELVSLVHPPSSAVQAEKLLRETGRTRPVPTIATGHEHILGTNRHGGRAAEVSLSEDQRSRHLYVVGASGTGKSTLLLNLILQDLHSGQGLAVLDPHGDLVDEVLRRLPPERLDDAVLIDPADSEYPIDFNILSAHSELERTLLASDLVAVFRRLSTSWGDQMTSVLGNAILAILESEQGGTLVDLRRFLVEPSFRKEFLATVRDSEVVYYWQKEFPLLAGKPQAPLLTRLDTFLRPKPIRYMVAQKESRLDLRHLMDTGKVLLARLSQGAIGEENASLLGTLLVSKLHQLAMSRQELAATERRPFYLYIDEFQNFVTPSMEAILSGARKYRLGLVLAHQDLRQIQSRSPEVLHSVLANPYARVCFRVGDHDAKTLAEGFQHFDARDLQSLGTGQAIMRIERSEYDFNLATPMLADVDEIESAGLREAVVRSTRERYGRPRAEIEALFRGSDVEAAVDSENVVQATLPSPPRREQAGIDSPAVPVSVSPPPSVAIATPAPSPGRGGKQHKYLQELIRRWADANGWRATIEERILDGLGHVDVSLRKGELAVACEIGVTTSPDHEVQNIQKCLAAGFGRVVHVSADQKSSRAIRAELPTALAEEQVAKVVLCTPEGLLDLLDTVENETQASEQTVRGYRVKVRVRVAKPEAKEEKRGAVAAVIARAMKRMRRSR